MLRLLVVLGVASGALAADDSSKSCKSTASTYATQGSSMISTRHVTVTAPGIVEPYSTAKLADAPDAVLLAADDGGAVIEEESAQPQGDSVSTLTLPSRLQTFTSAFFFSYTKSAVYYAFILMAGFMLAATAHGLRQAIAGRMAPRSDMEKLDKLHCCRGMGSGDANKTDAFGCTALHLAALKGPADAVCALLAANADANARETWDETPLHFAARAGHAEVCAALLKFKAEANASNASGFTPLVEAARAGKRASCSILLDHGGHAGGISDEQLPPMLSMLMLSRILSEGQDVAAHSPE
mmetsp:Transcript_131589/g.256349  ORF Transcript_131589/g.256349 Transcript_131589/m.256349 type:complete len:298 (+) Transcript_131589:85-978(+)